MIAQVVHGDQLVVQAAHFVEVTPERMLGSGLITGRQLKAARAMLGIEQAELARRARVARGTVRRMESFDGEVGSRTSTLSKVQAVLERAGVEFLGGDSPGVRLRPMQAKAGTPPRKR